MITLTVDEFLQCVCLHQTQYAYALVPVKYVDVLKTHKDYNKFFFIEGAGESGFCMLHSISSLKYWHLKVTGWMPEEERIARHLPKDYLTRNHEPQHPDDLKKWLIKELKKAMDAADFPRIKELRDRLKPLLL